MKLFKFYREYKCIQRMSLDELIAYHENKLFGLRMLKQFEPSIKQMCEQTGSALTEKIK